MQQSRQCGCQTNIASVTSRIYRSSVSHQRTFRDGFKPKNHCQPEQVLPAVKPEPPVSTCPEASERDRPCPLQRSSQSGEGPEGATLMKFAAVDIFPSALNTAVPPEHRNLVCVGVCLRHCSVQQRVCGIISHWNAGQGLAPWGPSI